MNLLKWVKLSLMVSILLGGLALPAFSATQTVSSTADSGAGSLRQVITDATAGDTIVFNLTYPATITLSSTLSIAKNLSIKGPGVASLTISGNNAVRVFDLTAGTITISDLTISNGRSAVASDSGGGIRLGGSANLTLDRCKVSNCSLTGSGDLFGGGISVGATATLTDLRSHFYQNTVLMASPGGGGAIYNLGTLTVVDSTFEGNSAYMGGALRDRSEGKVVTLEGCTFSGNSSDNQGVVAHFGNSNFNVVNCTITKNYSTNGSNSYEAGLSVYNNSGTPGGTFTLKNTVVAGNVATTGGGDSDIYFDPTGLYSGGITFTFTSGGYNLIGSVGSNDVYYTWGPGDVRGTEASPQDANLANLADNGGYVLSHLPNAGSLVLNPASSNGSVFVDGRGYIRAGATSEKGATEYLGTAPVATAASGIAGSGFSANWNAVTGATGYLLDVATDAAFTAMVTGYRGLDAGNVLTNSVTGLSAGTTYYYRVRGYNSGLHHTHYTNTITVTSTPPPPTVTTQAASPIAATSATGNGNITATGGANATARGVIYWGYNNTDQVLGDGGVTNVSEAGNFGTGAFTASLTSLAVNTQYNARAHATSPSGTGYGARVAFWTLANVPSAPTVNNATATTLDVTVNVNGNPASTEFAIQETGGNYVQAGGTLGGSAVWQTAAAWGTKTVTGLTTGSTYTFQVKARNGGSTETAFGATTSGVPVAAPTVTTQAASTIAATSATGNGNITATNGANATARGIIYYTYTNTDKNIGDAGVTDISEPGNFGTGAFTAALTPLAVNIQYNARAYATSASGTGYGARVAFWTLANVPSAPTVNNATATTLDVTVNVNGNPASTEFAIQETGGNYVQAGGTLGGSAVWQTAAVWGTKTVTGLTTGSTYTFQVKARNGGSTETAFGATATMAIVGVASPTINEDTDSGAIAISGGTAYYKTSGITGGTLFSNAGLTTQIANGEFFATAGATTNVYFRPTANFNGAAGFSVQGSTTSADGGLTANTAISTITVTPVADTPSITPASTTPATQTSSGLVASRNVADGTEVTYFKITNIANGTLYQNNGATAIVTGSFITYAQANAGLKFTPSGASNGSFDLQASTSNLDAGLGGSVVTASITVGVGVASPTINEDTDSGAIAISGSTAFYKITAITGGTLYSNAGFTTQIAIGNFIATAGATTNVYFRPTANFNGAAGFSVQGSSSAADAGLTANTATSTITVTSVADTPSVASPTINEDTDSVAIAITRNAADGAETSHYKITGITGGTLYSDAGFTVLITNSDFIASAGATTSVYFRPTANRNSTTGGNGSFIVQASKSNLDAGLGGATATATITLTPVADTPSVASPTIIEDTDSGAIGITRNAADGAETSHYKVTGITGGTLYSDASYTAQITTGSFIVSAGVTTNVYFRPTANRNATTGGNGSFIVQASKSNVDAGLGGSTATSTITLTPVADTPNITPATTTPATQTSSGLVVSRNVADGTEVTYFKITNIANGTLYQNNGTSAIVTGSFITYAQANAGLKFTPSGASNGSFDLQASISNADAGLGGSVVTAIVTVATPPTIAKVFGAATIPLNGSTTLSFTVTNPIANFISLTGLAFTDNLPAGLVVATPNGLTGSCGGGAITATAGAGSISLSGATLATNSNCTFSVNVTGSTVGVKNNSVQITSMEAGAGNTANAGITVVGPPVILKTFGAASIPLNGSTSLSFTIQNNNTSTALTGIGFSDTLPAGLVVATPNGLSGSCGGGAITATQATSNISLSGATLPASSSCTFALNVTGTTAGTKSNTTGNVTSTEGGTGGSASASLNVVTPPTISNAFGVQVIALNGSTTLTFTITNPAANAMDETGVAFTDTLPSGLVVATPNGLTNSCGGSATAVAGSTSIALTGGSVVSNTSCTVVVNVTCSTTGNKNNTTGTVSSTNGGVGSTSNTATLTVGTAPAITSANGMTLTVTAAGSFQVTATGNPLPALNSTGTLPTGVTFTDNGNGTATISGTPALGTVGDHALTITAANGIGSDASQSFTLTVNKSTQTITLAATATKTYGDADFGLGATVPSGLPLTYSSNNLSVATVAADGLIHIVGAGEAIITASQAGDGNYNAASAQQTITVSKAIITVTADNKSRAYGAADPAFTATYSGFAYGDNSSVITGTPTFTTTATSSSTEGSYSITPVVTGLSAANYNFTAAPGTLAVGVASQSITFNPLAAKTYGDATFTLNATGGASGNSVTYSSSNTNVATISGATVTITGAGTTTITADQTGTSGAYATATAQQTLTVNKATITVTAASVSREYNSANPTLTSSFSGFVNNENGAVISGEPTVTTTAMQTSPVGSYPVTATINTLTATNYNFTFVGGTLAVGLAGQSITFDALAAKTYGDVPFDLNATGGASGNQVTFASSNEAVATVSGMAVIIKGAGTATITASQAGNSNYASATAQQTLTVGKAPLTVTADNKNRTYGAANPSFTATHSGFVNNEDATALQGAPSLTTTADSTSAPGSYPINATVGNLFSTNYNFSYISGTLTIDKATAIIALGNLNQAYDATPKSATAITTPNGLVIGVTYDGSATAPTNTGSYAVVATVIDSNYQGSASGTLVVSKGTASVTLGNLSTTYDGTAKSITATTIPAGKSVAITYNGSTAAPTNSGSYAVVGTINDNSYQGFAIGTLEISKGTATVSLGSLSAVYDGSAKMAAATTIPTGKAISITYNGSTTAPTNTGSYAVIATISDSNYLGTASGTLIITDGTAPTLTVSTLANQAVTTNATLNISGTASDSESGIKNVTIDGQDVTISNGSFTAAFTLVDGPNTITTIATDTADNKTTDTRTITLDRTAPGLTITVPADNSITNKTFADIAGSIDDQTSTVTIKTNGGTATSATMDGAGFSATLNLTAGLNTIDIIATDQIGNSSSSKRTITSDTTAPTLAITVPAQDISTTQAGITISGTVTDSLTSATITISVNGQYFETLAPIVPVDGKFSWFIEMPTDKTYAVIVTATDQAGNSATVQRNIIKATISASGDVTGDGVVDIADALKALRIAVGLDTATADNFTKGDVAPLKDGKPAPDGIIDIADAVVILQKSVGLMNW